MLIYLDTHVVVWLYAGLTSKFEQQTKALLNTHDVLISPIVRLELQYLHEIGRVSADCDTITTYLAQKIGLAVCAKPFNEIVTRATTLFWIRDPFDRIIVAHASLDKNLLLSKDQTILNNYPFTRW